jgi:hypothetical protein
MRQHYVSEVENGRHNVTVGTMVKLAGAVGGKAINLLRKRPGGPCVPAPPSPPLPLLLGVAINLCLFGGRCDA